MEMQDLKDISKCPFHNGTLGNEKSVSTETNGVGNQNEDWWPDRLTLDVLRQHSPLSDPMGESFEYKKEFESLDLASVKKELAELMTDSQDWWPADFGHYGPFLFEWPGIVPELIGYTTEEGEPAADSKDLLHSTVGLTTPIWIRRDAYYGRLSKNMGKKYPGLT